MNLPYLGVMFLFLSLFATGCLDDHNDEVGNKLEPNLLLVRRTDRSGKVDTIFKYDNNQRLLSKEVFRDSLLNGISTYYYSNGIPKMTTGYSHGYKNGENRFYDSSGKIIYMDFYYFDLTVGPVVYFDKFGDARHFFFASLQNETLLDIDYRKWKGIATIHDKIVNFVVNRIKNDEKQEIELLIYLPQPPKMNFEFSIYKISNPKEQRDYKLISKIDDQLPFKILRLPTLPNNENYSVGVSVYDSLLNKRTIIYKDL